MTHVQVAELMLHTFRRSNLVGAHKVYAVFLTPPMCYLDTVYLGCYLGTGYLG